MFHRSRHILVNRSFALLVSTVCLVAGLFLSPVVAVAEKPAASVREAKYLGHIHQVTHGFPRAGEGYFSPDGKQIVYQAYPIGYPFYQIYVQKLGGPKPPETTGRKRGRPAIIGPRRISPGRGRTTCSYFSPDNRRILFASSHSDPNIAETERKARELAARGGRRHYQWDFDPHMEIYVVNVDGTGMKRLTNSPGYDAEGSFSADGRQIVFTSSRDGDPDIYIMNADGSHTRQITNTPGYDGGPFFSPDMRWIIFRSDRQKQNMLQLYAISVEGQHEVQLTHNLGTVNWAPYFHPSGRYIIWGRADYSHGRGSFNLYTMEIKTSETTFTGGKVTQITDNRAADILPVFSPNGKKLMWTSTRTPDGSSQLWIADWLRETRPTH